METSVYWDAVRTGDFHMTHGSPAGAINDPSDYWGQCFKSEGPQNYAKWSHPRFDALLGKIDREMDVEKRRTLVRQAEDLLDEEVPCSSTAGTICPASGTSRSRASATTS